MEPSLTADKYDRMNLNEVLDALKFTKSFHEPEEIKITNEKTKWIEIFKPLLEYIIEKTEDKKISSSELSELWLFFTEGLRVRQLFVKLSQEQIYEVLQLKNPLEHILYDDDVIEMTKNGVFLYQVSYYLTIAKYRLEESIIRYKTIYTSENPIDWVKNNNNQFRLEIKNKKFSEKNTNLLNLWLKVLKVSNVSLDPVFQK